MRDLGTLGESVFKAWCAHEGLIANESGLDRTGWDFLVEFPPPDQKNPGETHYPALECKVQVKATDKKDRKLQIKLSNLRRLATAPMPGFILFIEFDGEANAQRAFLVHVDEKLITQVLQKIHKLEQVDGRVDHHKASLLVKYNDEHAVEMQDGSGKISIAIKHYVGPDLLAYVDRKKRHLVSTGYEDGYATVSFTSQNISDLIDVSIGARKSVELDNVVERKKRFGIHSSVPTVEAKGALLEMPDLSPTAIGKVRFREGSFGPALTFDARFFVSPFFGLVSPKYQRLRIESDCFDITMTPAIGVAHMNFSIGAIRLPVKQLRDSVRLVKLVRCSGGPILASFSSDNLEKYDFTINGNLDQFQLENELTVLEDVSKVVDLFGQGTSAYASLGEISRNEEAIARFCAIALANKYFFKIDFSVDGEGFDPESPVICVIFMAADIGDHRFGMWLIVQGVSQASSDGRFTLLSQDYKAERVFAVGPGETISEEVLRLEGAQIKASFGEDAQVLEIIRGLSSHAAVQVASSPVEDRVPDSPATS